jgi:hypothetical protein
MGPGAQSDSATDPLATPSRRARGESCQQMQDVVSFPVAMSSNLRLKLTLPVLLVVLCQGVLLLHDIQHVAADVPQCAICQAHLPQIAVLPGECVPVPASTLQFMLPLRAPDQVASRTPSVFRSRSPPPQQS